METNSKPLLLKRFIADGFDIVSLLMIFMLLNILLPNSILFKSYNEHLNNYKAIEQEVLNNNSSDSVNEILINNEEYQYEVFTATLYGNLGRMFIGFICELLLLLVIPLLNNNLTLGKALTGIILFDESRQNKANKKQIVYRFILILLTSLALYPWTGIYTFALFPVLRFISLIINEKNRSLIDFITSTMYIEKLTYSSIV